MKSFVWKIGGEAGFGIMTTGLAFAKIASRSGYHAFDYTEYPSLIRGGHNTYEVVVSSDEVTATVENVDILVCLNKDTFDFHKNRLTAESIVVYDPAEFDFTENFIKVAVPFKQMKRDFIIMQVMVNTIALAASLALIDADINILFDLLTSEFQKKGQEVVDFNKKLAQSGYDQIKQHHSDKIKSLMPRLQGPSKLVLGANDAFSLAAVAADCRFYVAYPMTPSSSVLASLAGWQEKTGMVVRHAEDEISVINTALGAAHAGVRSAVGSSGGGFALMVEAISFAGVAEIPIVIFLAQRPGPATGLPSWTEQADLMFATQAGHGEFPKIVLAPGDPLEMLDMTLKAFDFADIYQTPVIIMSDKVLSESHLTVPQDQVVSLFANHQNDYGKKVRETMQSPYLRYKLTEDGISERLVPGAKGHFYQSNSYSHIEDSHTTEDAEERKKQVDKINKKWEVYKKNHFKAPQIFGDADNADFVFVSWGGSKGAIQQARKILEEQGKKTAYMHFTYVYPLVEEQIKPLFKEGKRYILVENNSHGQFGKILRMETGVNLTEKILKYDGRPFWPEEIVAYCSK